MPAGNARELWHHGKPARAVLARHQDTVEGYAFRDDEINRAGVQTPGEIGWRLAVNDTVVEASLEDMELALSAQLDQVRTVIDALGRVPRARSA